MKRKTRRKNKPGAGRPRIPGLKRLMVLIRPEDLQALQLIQNHHPIKQGPTNAVREALYNYAKVLKPKWEPKVKIKDVPGQRFLFKEK